MGSIVWIGMIVLLIIGLPIGYALMALAIILLESSGVSTSFAIAQKTVTSLHSFTMLAIPFFMLAGEAMSVTNISAKLFRFAGSLVRHLPGSLAHVNILTSMFLAGCSGSSVADITGVGRLEIEAMEDAGMPTDFAAATTCASACMAPIIPPSMNIVLYASISGVSIGSMLVAGVLPGVLMGFIMMVYCYFYCKKKNYGVQPRVTMKELWKTFVEAIPGLALPIIILGGILSGKYTATEAAAIGAAYAIVLGLVFYRNLNFKGLMKILGNVGLLCSTTMCIMYGSSVFGLVLTSNHIPQKICEFFVGLSDQRWIILLTINLALLLLGCLMDCTPILLILSGTLALLGAQLNMDPVQFGIMVVLNVTIGLATPPVGMALFVTQRVAGISTKTMFKSILPFLAVMFVTLLLVTFVEPISTWLPSLI